jgi:3-oxoacyl-[acyl-carrier-protein] synthase II
MSNPLRRVAITGMGIVSPIGCTLESFWSALASGQSGIHPIESFPTDELPTRIAGTVRDFVPEDFVERKQARYLDRSQQFAIAAARLALADAGLDPAPTPDTMGVSIGIGVGCIGVVEAESEALRRSGPRRVSPFLAATMLPSMPAAQVSLQLGLRGPIRAISTACATGADNVAHAADLIRLGQADVMVAGGAEAPLTPLVLAAFAASRSLSRNNEAGSKASRPFDRRRDGFVMGEGSGIVVLENYDSALARGARIYAELLGYASTGDAYHLTAPREDGEGLVRCIRLALGAANRPAESVDYVNAHGTSTPLNDRVETAALKTALGPRARQIPVNSTKSMVGHLLGATGAVELIATVLEMRNGFVHPTINYEEPDPDCDLDYVPNVGRPAEIRVAMSTSLGFGGHNAVLVVGAV